MQVYLTLLFILPLRSKSSILRLYRLLTPAELYSYRNNKNTPLHIMAFRSFVGSCATLTSSVINLTVLMVLRGEPGWICLMCCNADILFSVLVLHWVTQIDRNPSSTSTASQPQFSIANNTNSRNVLIGPCQLNSWSGGSVVAEPQKALGSMTTECRAARQERRRESDEDIVELGGIHVHTETTTDVEVDERSEARRGSCRAEIVNAEKMV